MSIFSRFKDIVSSNISSMLDKAEDPEKLIRLMLREMEETLVELKAGCAATMAEAAKARRSLDEAAEETAQWEHRAELALRAGREDMAREALPAIGSGYWWNGTARLNCAATPASRYARRTMWKPCAASMCWINASPVWKTKRTWSIHPRKSIVTSTIWSATQLLRNSLKL